MTPSTPEVFGAPLLGDVMVEVRFNNTRSAKRYYYFTHICGRGSWRPKPGAKALVYTGGRNGLAPVEIVAVHPRDPAYLNGGQNLQKPHPEFAVPHKRLHSCVTATGRAVELSHGPLPDQAVDSQQAKVQIIPTPQAGVNSFLEACVQYRKVVDESMFIPQHFFVFDKGKAQQFNSNLSPSQEEDTMNKIEIVTKTLINGREADFYSEDDLFDMLMAQQEQLERAEKIASSGDIANKRARERAKQLRENITKLGQIIDDKATAAAKAAVDAA